MMRAKSRDFFASTQRRCRWRSAGSSRSRSSIADATHRRREAVIGGLAEIDLVIGVNGILVAALAAQALIGQCRDDLVEVHVGLGAGAGLPNHQRKLVVIFAGFRIAASNT